MCTINRFLDTEIDDSTLGCINVLCLWARHLIYIASVVSADKWVPVWDTSVKGVCSVLSTLHRVCLIIFCLLSKSRFEHEIGMHCGWQVLLFLVDMLGLSLHHYRHLRADLRALWMSKESDTISQSTGQAVGNGVLLWKLGNDVTDVLRNVFWYVHWPNATSVPFDGTQSKICTVCQLG